MTKAAKNWLKVLVADDSTILRKRLLEMLSGIRGIKVVGQAQDARETLASIHALRPEAVILDIQMPGGSGIDVLRELKRDFPETVVIILTNHAEPQYQQKCADLKADYFLSKSADWKALIAIAEKLARAKAMVNE